MFDIFCAIEKEEFLKRVKPPKSNLLKAKKRAGEEFKQCLDIIIFNADKGENTMIMQKNVISE